MAFAARAAMAIAVVLSMLVWQSAEAAGPLRSFARGLWSGGAYTDDRTGEFTHCSAGVAYDSGINLFVLVTPGDRWWLGFIDPQWKFTAKENLPVELRLDRDTAVPRGAMVPRDDLLLVPLPGKSNLVDTFRHSARLTLIAQKAAYRFKLADVSAVLDALSGCVRQSLALEQGASSSAGAGREPQTPGAAIPAATSSADAFAGGSVTARPAAGSAAAVAAAASPAGPKTTDGRPIAGDSGISPPPSNAMDAASPAPPGTAATPPHEQLSGPQLPAASASIGAPHPAGGLSVTVASPPISPKPGASTEAPPQPALLQGPVPSSQPPALEEIRLARDFLAIAGLANARLIMADKPPALASFAAVWRSDAAAGAVKIIPASRDVSGIGIASDLIAVDPRMCKGNFSAARSHTLVGRNEVYSAILSCTQSGERRTAQYFVTPRRQGGFVVFAVVGSGPGGAATGVVQQRIDQFTRAAARAAQKDG